MIGRKQVMMVSRGREASTSLLKDKFSTLQACILQVVRTDVTVLQLCYIEPSALSKKKNSSRSREGAKKLDFGCFGRWNSRFWEWRAFVQLLSNRFVVFELLFVVSSTHPSRRSPATATQRLLLSWEDLSHQHRWSLQCWQHASDCGPLHPSKHTIHHHKTHLPVCI